MVASLGGCAQNAIVEQDSDNVYTPAKVTKIFPANKNAINNLAQNTAYELSHAAYELHHRADFSSKVKGIYISQSTLENREYLQYLINRSQKAGINTFVIDVNAISATAPPANTARSTAAKWVLLGCKPVMNTPTPDNNTPNRGR